MVDYKAKYEQASKKVKTLEKALARMVEVNQGMADLNSRLKRKLEKYRKQKAEPVEVNSAIGTVAVPPVKKRQPFVVPQRRTVTPQSFSGKPVKDPYLEGIAKRTESYDQDSEEKGWMRTS